MEKLRRTAMLAIVTSFIVMWASGLVFVQPVQAIWAEYTRYHFDTELLGTWGVLARLDSDTKTLLVFWSGPDKTMGNTFAVFSPSGSTLYVRVDEWYNGQYWGYHWLEEGILSSTASRVFDYRSLWPPYTYDQVHVRVTWHYIKYTRIVFFGIVFLFPSGERYISVQVDFSISPYTFY